MLDNNDVDLSKNSFEQNSAQHNDNEQQTNDEKHNDRSSVNINNQKFFEQNNQGEWQQNNYREQWNSNNLYQQHKQNEYPRYDHVECITTENKAMCAVGYLGILVLIPIFGLTNKSEFDKKHINCSISITLWSLIGVLLFIPIIVATVMMWFNETTIVIGMMGYFGTLAILMVYSICLCIAQITNLVFAAIGKDAKLPILKTFKFFK